MKDLAAIVIDNGFEIIDSGSYFIKPFTHSQMEKMVDAKIIDKDILDGLYNLGENLLDLGAEIFVNCKIHI